MAGKGGVSLVIRPSTLKEAEDFVNLFHRHHRAPVGGKFAICCADPGGTAHGCAICGRPVARRLDNGLMLEITRVCTDGTRNACSKLYGACLRIARDMGCRRVITYTLKSECGVSLKASNFINEGEAGGLHWTGRRDTGIAVPHEMKIRWAFYF